MSDIINQFYDSIEDAEQTTLKEEVSFFVYFLTVKLGLKSVTTKDVNKCFSACHLKQPARTASYLSEGCRSKPPKFLKVEGGYKMERYHREEIATRIGAQKVTQQTNSTLRSLENRLKNDPAESFLKETLDCFEVRAYRATVIMTWILVVDRLYSYIWTDKKRLENFNKTLAGNTDKRVKIKKITKRDDFCEIPEGTFINFCKKSRIISSDIHRILETSIRRRNSAAHPSGIKIKELPASAFVEDLVENVILKYT